ncbi:MAG: protease complex subunit PrcB family protein [Rhodothermales bacterium]|nr:protease complex subunit PrcB family protein [Rhodothermales bacterium]
MIARFLPLVLLAGLLTGCLGSTDGDASVEVGAEALYFEPVGIGQAGTLSDTTEIVLRTPEEWSAIRDSLRSPEAFRSVDFSQTMLMVAALPQPSGGYRIQFESVEKEGDDIIASYAVYGPAADCITIMGRTLPFQVIAVRVAAGNVTFRRRLVLESCELD